MQTISCKHLLTVDGWRSDQVISIDEGGHITAITPWEAGDAFNADILIPAPPNLHSHAFQRAMAGMTERRGPDGRDSFWTWRTLMYRFLDVLTPDHVCAIAAFMQMESLEAGFGSVVEFHYLHHQPDGAPYVRLSEMSERIVEASAITGCGLTLLPVLYHQGGCDGRALGPGQIRFGCNIDRYRRLLEEAAALISAAPADTRLGVAPHSLRAVNRAALAQLVSLAENKPIHIHAAEQAAEVDEVKAAYGSRPVEWLLANAPVDARWCLIHATQMTPAETVNLAKSGAVAGLCPLTEANLGDGPFDGVRYLKAQGRFGVGSDSNVQIDLAAELRQLEYSQRLRDRSRAALATEARSTARRLIEDAARGGAQAAARGVGRIEVGALADLAGLRADAVDFIGKTEDTLLDAWVFSASEQIVSDVWSAGRHVVQNGQHIARDIIRARYVDVMRNLGGIV
ncbi:MAG: formimidoylglutamate deiminase [Rhodobacteraceae bacterium]|nr:formimidoylglutamate deiminase [Paracoccaceae bacterium]